MSSRIFKNPAHQPAQVTQQNALPGIDGELQVPRDMTDALVVVDLEGVPAGHDARHQRLESPLSGKIFDQNLNVQGSSRVEVVAVPEPAQGQALFHQILHDGVLTRPADHRETIATFFENPNFLGG